MRPSSFVLPCLVALATLPAALGAQATPPEEPPRVRVWSPLLAGSPRTGILLGSPDDVLRLREGEDGPVHDLALADIDRLEISRGRRARTKTGFVVGVGVGLAAGLVGGWLWAQDDNDGVEAWTAQVVGTAAGTLSGALLGLAIGSAIHAERWEEVNPRDLR